MPLRIGFDLDGTLADFAAAFHEVEVRLYGAEAHSDAGQPEKEQEEGPASEEEIERRSGDDRRKSQTRAKEGRRRRDAVWNAIRKTPNFWTHLEPLDADAVRRIHEMTLRHKWEVFFITQRPYTDGDTVQRQSQRWLVTQGFDMPSVLVIGGSRGAAAAALRLDYHVDDSPQNCLDVLAESGARPILIVASDDEATVQPARTLKIGTAKTIAAALDILEQATLARTNPSLLDKLATLVGWR
jgi:FMN phosphatase YigB (HAD superfamily)